MITDFSEYIFRCHAVGKIMAGVGAKLTVRQKETLDAYIEKKNNGKITDPQLVTLGKLIEKRDAKPTLSSGAKTYLNGLHQEAIFGRTKRLTSKYLDKGIRVEDDSIALYSNYAEKYYTKNAIRFNNEYLSGEPDNDQDGVIRDFKSSWDFATFPMHEKEIKNKEYFWQLMGYMWLTGFKKAELIYCLVDSPFDLIDDALRKLSWQLGCVSVDSMPREVVVETVSNMIYTLDGLEAYCHQSTDVELEWFHESFKEIIPEHRIKVFKCEYSDESISQMKTQIQLARDYMNEMTLTLASVIKPIAA